MPVPILAPASDDAPCPRVAVTIDDLPSAATSATLWRTAGGRRVEVRDAVRRVVSGVLSVVDFEAPLDAEATYQAQLFNAAGVEVAWTDAASTRVISPRWGDGRRRVLIHNPLDPRTALWVQAGKGFAESVVRPIPGEVRWSEGRALGLLQAGKRRGLVGVPLPVVTETWEDGQRFDALFGTPDVQRLPILCVRIPGELRHTRLPAVWFAAVLQPEAVHTFWKDELLWRMVADEVAAPVPMLVMPPLRRRDVAAYYASRQAVKDGNASRLALSRRFEIAGAGGD